MQIVRLIYIGFVLARYRIDHVLYDIPGLRSLRFLRFFNPFYYLWRQNGSHGKRLRIALERLGPIFVKFGQLLGTRRDLLSTDIADELSKLQDKVPPFSAAAARKIIETALRQPIPSVFDDFTAQPIASASVAQVHAATLKDGTAVVIKVLRPGIETVIDRDMALLRTFAGLFDRLFTRAHHIRMRAVVQELDRALHCELDLQQEAENARRLRADCRHVNTLYIPKVYDRYSQRHMLVLERVDGIPANQIDALRQAGIDTPSLGNRLIEIFFTQVFEHNFFHADLHPGNIFIAKNRPAHFIFVDFGIAGSLSESDRRYIADNLLAFFNRDYPRIADLHRRAGWLPPQEDATAFTEALRNMCEPYFQKPLKEISIGKLLLKLFETARRFHINIQPQLILLQKNLLHVENLSRQFNPDLNLWDTAKPFLQRWMRRQVGVSATLRKVRRHMPYYLELLPELPELIEASLRRETAPVPPMPTRRGHVPSLIVGGLLLGASALNFALLPQAALSGWVLLAAGGLSGVIGCVWKSED